MRSRSSLSMRTLGGEVARGRWGWSPPRVAVCRRCSRSAALLYMSAVGSRPAARLGAPASGGDQTFTLRPLSQPGEACNCTNPEGQFLTATTSCQSCQSTPSMRTLGGEVARGRWGRSAVAGSFQSRSQSVTLLYSSVVRLSTCAISLGGLLLQVSPVAQRSQR